MKILKDIIENVSEVSFGTWARLAALVLSFINAALISMGVHPLPVSEEQVFQALSMILAAICAVAAYWKNNSFTAAAQAADKVLEEKRGMQE